jgi:hypothetical protein
MTAETRHNPWPWVISFALWFGLGLFTLFLAFIVLPQH